MSLGEILRTAREQRALSASTAAEATHMKVQIIEDLENEDFRRIAAPIYGRGFVKLYAEFLELDPAPLIREFMDLYSGKRAPAVGRRPVEATPPAAPEQEPTPITRTIRTTGVPKTEPLTRPQVRAVETEPAPEPPRVAQAPTPPAPPGPDSDPEPDDDPLTLTPCLTPTHLADSQNSDQPLRRSVSEEAPATEEPWTETEEPSEKRWVVEPETPFAGHGSEPDLFSLQMPQRQPVTTTPIVPVAPKTRKAPPLKRDAGPIFDVGHRLDTSRVTDTPQDPQTTKRQRALLKTFTDSLTRFKASAFNKGFSDDFLRQYRIALIAGGAFLVLCMLTGVLLLFNMTSKPKKEHTTHKFQQVAPIPSLYAD